MKQPGFMFYPGDWSKDPALRRCSHAAKGVWMDVLCLMFECDRRGVLATAGRPWSESEVASAVGGNQDVTRGALRELIEKGACRRAKRSGALWSARMVRDERIRRLRARVGSVGGSKPKANTQAKAKQITESENEDASRQSISSSSLPSAIYAAYPRHVGPRKAMAEIAGALNRIANGEAKKPPDIPEWPPPNPAAWLLDRTKQYAEATAGWHIDERQYIPHPSTFFHQDRYCDDPKQWQRNGGNGSNRQAAGSGPSRAPASTAASRGEFASDPGEARRL